MKVKRGIFLLISIFWSNIFAFAQSAEFFLQIDKPGTFRVTVADESVESNSGYFRFFDLDEGKTEFVVFDASNENLKKVFKGSVSLVNGSRTTARLNSTWKLTHVAEELIKYDSWYKEPFKRDTSVVVSVTDTSIINVPANELTEQKVLSQFIQGLRDASSESNRITIAKEEIFVRDHKFLAADILQICSQFEFESSKVEILKLAYGYCVDKQNFELVIDCLSYESSRMEIDKFLKSYR